MKTIAALIFTAFVGWVLAGQQTMNTCSYDGYYQCVDPIPYDWEIPSANAINISSSDYEGRFTPDFPMTGYGQSVYSDAVYFGDEFYLQAYGQTTQIHKSWVIVGMYYGIRTPNSIRRRETKGTAPNRRIVFTWENYASNGNGQPASVQIKYFENGSFEIHCKEYTYDSNQYMVNGVQYIAQDMTTYSISDYSYDFPYYSPFPAKNFNGFAMGMYVGPPPTTNVCGNLVVEGNEQCDGGDCCTSSCTFASSSQVCRAADGECDVAETCSGSSSECPADAFASSTTPCEEDFGVCDVRLNRLCPGNSGECSGFSVPVLGRAEVDWLGYSVISFQDFTADTGSVGGRLAVKRDVSIWGGFSVGSEILIQEPITPDIIATPLTYSFIAGGNATWIQGELFPDQHSSMRVEYGYVGGSFGGSEPMRERMISTGQGNVDSAFENARDYYISLSDNLNLETSNVNVTSMWSGLFFNCLDNSGRYIVHLDSTQFMEATWFSVDDASCAFGSTWVFNIEGDFDMVFAGGDFPGVSERILFNVLGANRNINVASGVNGNILSPQNNLIQTGGVMHGLVIVNNIAQWSSGTNPNCADLQPFSFLVPVQVVASLGSNTIDVVSFSIVHSGDKFVSNGVEYEVVKRVDNNGQSQIVLNQGLQSSINAGEFLKFTVDPNQARSSDPVVKQIVSNSGASVVALLMVIIAAFLF